MTGDLIGVIEAFYEPIEDDTDWLVRVAGAIDPILGAGLGTSAWMRSDDGSLRLSSLGTFEITPEHLSAYHESTALSDPRALVAATQGAPVTTLRCVDPAIRARLQPGIVRCEAVGVLDVVLVNAWNPDGSNVCLGAGRDAIAELTSELRGRLGRVAAHLAAALRLRRLDASRRARLDHAEAILSPDGALLHADAIAVPAASREPIRRAARAIEQARTRLRHVDPDEALASWTSLVNGRFTLVDAFDTDGRRFLVARVNAPSARGPIGLTSRELQIVAFRAAGHSSKLVAYELGLSEATVSRGLARAMQKLGVHDPVELTRALVTSSAEGSPSIGA